MDSINYYSIIRSIGARKSLGQHFLVNKEIAIMESEYARDLNVVELGPGLGILTRELCNTAKKVIAIEKDTRLFEILKNGVESEKLTIINDDFFSVDDKTLKKIDIMVSNIPYNLSSKVIYWLGNKNIPAVICVQKEFASHMLAQPGTHDYSKLSIVSSLRFKVHHIKDIAAGNFFPLPRVDSSLIYVAPRSGSIDEKTLLVITNIMNHKKKRLKNAIIDSAKGLEISKERARKISEEFPDADLRPFQMEPEKILMIAEKISLLVLE